MRHVEMQKMVMFTFRYYPPFCALIMLHHVIALIFGYDLAIHEFLVDGCLIACVMQTMLSYFFKFCAWHRACIYYNYIVSLCVDYQRSYGFGAQRESLRYIVIAIGFFIILMFSFKCHNQIRQENEV